MFVCFETDESAKQFLERSDIKSFKDNEMLVLSRYAVMVYLAKAGYIVSMT